MQPPQKVRLRRAKDYTVLRHVSERILALLCGNGWPASLAHRLKLQQIVVLESYNLIIDSEFGQPPPLKIAFASDFHAGPVTHSQMLVAACHALKTLQPDVLLLGGDFVSFDAKYIDDLADQVMQIPAPLGRFAVVGNHDLWADDYPIIRRLSDIGVQVLINRNVQLPPPYAHVWICGLDDASSGVPNARSVFRDADGVRIVLMHSPEGLRDILPYRFDLALCGHTHGGQIALPNGRPIFTPRGRLNRMYTHGRFCLDIKPMRTLIVSRGVGYGGLPIRLFADPDILLCTLTWNVVHGNDHKDHSDG